MINFLPQIFPLDGVKSAHRKLSESPANFSDAVARDYIQNDDDIDGCDRDDDMTIMVGPVG